MIEPRTPTAHAAVLVTFVTLVTLVTLTFVASCDGSSGAEARPAPPPAAPPRRSRAAEPPDASKGAIHHVLGTGQGLASGVGGAPPLSTSQPYGNRMFGAGVRAGDMGLTALLPLSERGVETMSSSFANLVTELTWSAGGTHDMLVSVHAIGGAPYRLMKKGTAAFTVSLAQVMAGRSIASASGLAYDVTAITSAGGDGDHVDKNTHLADDLAEWQRDFETDMRALTGQSSAIPLFAIQYSSFTEYDPTSPIPIAQLEAHVDHPGKVIVVGPGYPLLYGPDGVHLTNEGYRVMGEYYARAYRRVVVEHGTWEPLRPTSVTRAGAVITIRFLVPAPPLVLDTKLAADPGNMGFEYADDGLTPTLTAVELKEPDTIRLTLSAEPTAANRRVRYAYTGALGAHAGLRTGARGNLRDSDATPSRTGAALYDWCVHFDEPVP